MINDYRELKHKCLILPYEEFKQVMDDLYDYVDDEDDDGTCDFLWTFFNQHFEFKFISPARIKKLKAHGITYPNITLDDIAEYFMIDNISDIICYTNYQNPPVFIIYD